MIGNDIIKGLNAGKLQNISIRGTNGVLDLAPINTGGDTLGRDMMLIILSHPKVKSGIIYFAVNIVQKQVKEYLGLTK
jgi:predicted regulator of Ras-like GTPase activity (Roadblock/LC7/MglB family)